MSGSTMAKAILTFGIVAVTTSVMAQPVPKLVPHKVLFIGDSLTFWQNGVYAHFESLAAAATPPLVVTADKSIGGGAFLSRLWNQGGPVKAIDTGNYDVIVLQEDIPDTTVADFREYVRKFVGEIRKYHARPVLFMAWAYPKRNWISMAEIAQAHRDAAKELNVDVAPVGLAWERASKQRPEVNLFGPDLEHPSIHGTYLATCVIYATIYGQNPGGLAYFPTGVTSEDAAFLQGIAWRMVQDYRAGRV
jgi:hypothetical protein